jgi:hypothetical protein
MAEKSVGLSKVESGDALANSAGAAPNDPVAGFPENYSDTEVGELATNTGDAPEETEQIRAQIEHTRSQMGETIDAIQERLSFSNISDQVSETVNDAIETAKDKAYDATIGKAVNFMKNVGDDVKHSGAFQAARKNPLPFALIGIGAGLLAYQSFGGSSRRANGRTYPKGVYDYENGETTSTKLGSAKRAIGDTAHRAYDGITEKAHGALETVSTAAESGYEKVTETVSNAYSGAGELAHRAYERAGEYGTIAHEKYDKTLEENPLALGAVALAIGAAVGFAIPSTRYEGKLMGDARDQVIRRAQSAAGELVDRAKHVAGEAGETIKDETRAALGH